MNMLAGTINDYHLEVESMNVLKSNKWHVYAA